MGPGWVYYYPSYYNQIPGHHQAAQHAAGHPIYVPGPPMPMSMYGHHMMGAYPQGMFMYPTAGTPTSGAQPMAMAPAPGPTGVLSPTGFVQINAEEGQYDPQAVAQPVDQMGPPATAAPSEQMWNQEQGAPMAMGYQEIVPPHEQQMPQTGEVNAEVYGDPGNAPEQQPFMEQSTLNPNVANFMTLKQQQELNQQQQPMEQTYEGAVEAQGVHVQPIQMIPNQEMIIQPGYEHLAPNAPPQALAFDMSGQPIVVSEGEIGFMDGRMLVTATPVGDFNQSVQTTPIVDVPVPQATEEVLVDESQAQPNVAFVKVADYNSPQVPVASESIVQDHNSSNTVNAGTPENVETPSQEVSHKVSHHVM